jgi:elongation factor 2
MAVSNIPSPIQAQKYRVPKIWRGSLTSEIGQSMLNCNEKGPTVICLTAVQTVPDGDLVATGRLFSGSVKQGDRVYLVAADAECRVEQVSIYMSAFREAAHEISAGNIAALTGLDRATAGETVVEARSKDAMIPFEPIKYVSESVITVAVEPKNSSDLPKLIEAGNRLSIEDPNITASINEDTGQYLLSGVGELHLEIGAKFLAQYGGGIELAASTPTVAYRESVSAQGRPVMTKSPNKQNKFWIQVQPLSSEVLKLIERGELGENTKQVQVEAILQQEADYRLEKARRVWALENHRNILTDSTKDSQDLSEVKNSVISGFHWACKTGPLCGEPLRGIEVKLIDATLHKDPKQREPTQVSRAISRAILGSCLTAKPSLLEPIYKIEITTTTQLFGACTSIITHRRGRIQHAEKKGILTAIMGYIPVAETFGLSAEMRSATSGRAFWQLTFDHWEKAPKNIAAQLIKQVRERRGLPAEIPKPEKFIDE